MEFIENLPVPVIEVLGSVRNDLIWNVWSLVQWLCSFLSKNSTQMPRFSYSSAQDLVSNKCSSEAGLNLNSRKTLISFFGRSRLSNFNFIQNFNSSIEIVIKTREILN